MLIYIQLSSKSGVTFVLLQIPTFCRVVSTILNLDQKPILRSPIGGNFFLALLYILIHILTKCRPYTILFGVRPYFQYNVWTSTWYILNICYFLDLIQVPRSSDYCLLFVCRIRTVSKANVWNIECLIFKHPNKIYQKDKY